MSRTRAKFVCHSVTDHGHNKTVKLGAVYSRKEGTENRDFRYVGANTTNPDLARQSEISRDIARRQSRPGGLK